MRKKSAKRAAKDFREAIADIESFVSAVVGAKVSDTHQTWAHEYAVLRLYRELEVLILRCLTAAINNDTKQLAVTTGVTFPRHMTDEVCEYLIVGDGYFDFRGRDGLIKTLRRFLPETHYLVKIIKQNTYKQSLERLSALRNFAAHNSLASKSSAKKAVDVVRLASAGAWLKKKSRFQDLTASLKKMAAEVEKSAPY